jgi:hypothetical protein
MVVAGCIQDVADEERLHREPPENNETRGERCESGAAQAGEDGDRGGEEAPSDDDESAACAGLWKRLVASKTARVAAIGSSTANSRCAIPSAMIRASCPTSRSTWPVTTSRASEVSST